MKIYYVANARMPSEKAHGIQLAKMCEAFIEQRVDLTLVVPAVGRRFSPQHPVFSVPSRSFLQKTAAGSSSTPDVSRKASAAALRAYYSLRVDVPAVSLPVLSMFPSSSWGFTLRAFSFAVSAFFYILFKRLRHGRDGAVVYTIDLDQFSYFLLPLAGFPVFFEAHGGKRASALLRFFLRRVRGIITNSTGTRDALVRVFGIALARTLVEPNGVDLTAYATLPQRSAAREQLGLSPDAHIALYVGRFYEWKELSILAEAAERLSEIEFIVVGGTEEEFRSVTELTTLPGNLRCVGGKPPQEIPLWLVAADVLLVLGTRKNEYSWRETSPMKLFEYMASHRPIVASRTPANQEIVSEDEALFYTADDAESLVRAIKRVFDESGVADQRANKAAAKVTQWSWHARAQRILDFLSRL